MYKIRLKFHSPHAIGIVLLVSSSLYHVASVTRQTTRFNTFTIRRARAFIYFMLLYIFFETDAVFVQIQSRNRAGAHLFSMALHLYSGVFISVSIF